MTETWTRWGHGPSDSEAWEYLLPGARAQYFDGLRKSERRRAATGAENPTFTHTWSGSDQQVCEDTFKRDRRDLVRFGFFDAVNPRNGTYRLSERWRDRQRWGVPGELGAHTPEPRERERVEKLRSRRKKKRTETIAARRCSKGEDFAPTPRGEDFAPTTGTRGGHRGEDFPPGPAREAGKPGARISPLHVGAKISAHSNTMTEEKISPYGPPYQQVIDEWNALARGANLPVVRELTDARRRAIQAQEKADGLAGYREVLRKVAASRFLTGKTTGNRGPFRATFDWIMKPANLAKTLEGNYDDARPAIDRACTGGVDPLDDPLYGPPDALPGM